MTYIIQIIACVLLASVGIFAAVGCGVEATKNGANGMSRWSFIASIIFITLAILVRP